MIKEKQKLTGNLNVKQSLSGKLGNAIICVDPITQEKEVMPTRTVQEIIPDIGYTGLSKVTVKGYTPNVATKTITKNGTYKASDDDLDGYSEVEVETSGVDINDCWVTTGTNYRTINYYIKKIATIDTSNLTYMSYVFDGCYNLMELPAMNTSKVIAMEGMLRHCQKLTTIPHLNTSNVVSMSGMFNDCKGMVTIPQLDLSKVTSVSQMFLSCYALTTLGGFQNLGMAYDTNQSANYSSYKLDLSASPKLTHDSLMNVINNLYDIANKGCNAQQLILGSTNLAKLTAEEIAIATNKGWTVS